jgi:hypothetical protein
MNNKKTVKDLKLSLIDEIEFMNIFSLTLSVLHAYRARADHFTGLASVTILSCTTVRGQGSGIQAPVIVF